MSEASTQTADPLVSGVDEAVERVVAEIGASAGTDPQGGLELADRALAALDRGGEAIRAARDDVAVAIWEREQLSLAQLAQLIGRSKARADQIVKSRRSAGGEGSQDGV